MALISNFVIISLIFTLIYFVGLLSFITENEENKCDMTYMYEYPQFVKISMPNGTKYTKYGLYAYSEGKFTEKARSMRFDGIPVLFIPGNAGSFKQARSLASVALRKALNSRSRYHFDFFTVDLNDELSGLNGALLNEQTQFLNESIQRVLTLYQKPKIIQPKSVILIGHSMGGVIAHSVVVNSEVRNVELLITMGSPHRSPMLAIDRHMKVYYDEINNKIGNTKLNNQTFISIGSGTADRHVNSWLTNANMSSLNVLATAVPGVWLTMDHLCIVWCKQLVLATVRALFDSIDPITKQLSSEHTYRLAAFKHHLLLNSGTKFEHASKYRVRTKLEPRGEWKESIERQYTVTTGKGKNIVNHYMIRLVDDIKYQALFVQAINLESPDWIFACTATTIQGQSRICDDNVLHLSHRSEIAPSAKKFEKRRLFYFDLFRLRKRYPEFTHVVIKLLPSEQVTLNFDLHNPKERVINTELPGWYSLSRKVILKETFPQALRYVVDLPGLSHIAQTYLLYVEPISCTTTSHQATAKLHLPWAHQDTHNFITEGIKKPLVLRLHNSRPVGINSTAKVFLNLDPSCRYTISVRSSFIGMLSQMSRYYSPLLLANIAAVVLMAYYSQMLHLEKEGRCLNFQSALSVSTKPYYIVTTAKLLSRLFAWGRFQDIFPTPDGYYLLSENLDFLILPILLYITSVGLTYMISCALWTVLIVSESTVHKLVAKGVTRTIGGAVKLSDWLLNALHKVPCVVAITLFSLGLSTCGGMALCIGAVYYFLKLTHMCQEYIESLVFRYIKKMTFKFIGLFSRKQKKDAVVEQTKELDQSPSEEGSSKKEEIQLNNEEKIIEENFEIVPDSREENELRLREVQEQDLQENQDHNQSRPSREKKSFHDSIHFHFTIFLLWLIVSAIGIPSVLTWARNFHYSNHLNPDPSSIPGVVLSLCAIFLWQIDLPNPNKLYYKEIAKFLYFMAIVCLVYAPISIYRLPYFLSLTIVVVTLHQLFAPEHSEEVEDEILSEPDPVEKIADIKSKLE